MTKEQATPDSAPLTLGPHDYAIVWSPQDGFSLAFATAPRDGIAALPCMAGLPDPVKALVAITVWLGDPAFVKTCAEAASGNVKPRRIKH